MVSVASDFLQQCSCRAFVFEGDRMYVTAPATHFRRTDDIVRRPVSALHQDVRANFEDAFDRRVFIKPGHQIYAFKGGDDCKAVFEGIDRTVNTLAQTAYRSVRVERHDERTAEYTGARKIGGVAAMQNVEAAVGEYQRARNLCDAFAQVSRRADFFFVIGWVHGGYAS